jgi:hypothetical protein
MRANRCLPRALAMPAAVGVAFALVVAVGHTRQASADPMSASLSSRAAAANAALDVASRRSVGAREALRAARTAVPPARTLVARRHAVLAKAQGALGGSRRANPGYVAAYDAATATVRRTQAVFSAATRAVASGAARLRSATTKRRAAALAAAHAGVVVDAAQLVVDDLIAAIPSPDTATDSPELTAAKAELASAQLALARARDAQTRSNTAYQAADARARHDRAVHSHAAASLRAARVTRNRLLAREPRGLAATRIRAIQAAVAYQQATSALSVRSVRLHNATIKARSADAAFKTAAVMARRAVSTFARSPVCPPGNAYAGARKTRVMSAPGLTITRYQKAGRMPMWVTSANLAGAGPQIRPGPLTPAHVSDRSPQTDQLAGSHAFAAVNGDFFDIGGDQAPWGPEVKRGGVIVKGSAAPRWESLIIARNGLADVDYLAFDITLHHGKASVRANVLNGTELPRDGIAVFTSRWGKVSRGFVYPTQGVREYVVNAHGKVSAVHAGITGTAIPRGGMVIVAQGGGMQRLHDAGIRGSARVSMTAKVQTKVPGGVYSAIGIGQVLIRHGVDSRLGCSSDGPVARTLVGIKPGGQELFAVTVQRRTKATPSGGLSVRQAQGLLRSLGAYDAVMFDGGGSTMLTARLGASYKIVSKPRGDVRPLPNSFAFWPR